MLEYKVIEGSLLDFERELNNFTDKLDVHVHDIKYSTSMMQSDHVSGWYAEMVHCALITYEELK